VCWDSVFEILTFVPFSSIFPPFLPVIQTERIPKERVKTRQKAEESVLKSGVETKDS
jgi:hypothetical protein